MKSHLLRLVFASFSISYTFLTSAASFTPLGFLNHGTSSYANDISADGTVVVGNANSNGPSMATPFIWTAASGMQSLGSISGTEFLGSATAVSGNGSVVVGQSNDLAYRWSATTGKATLGSGTATDVSADGSVVVGDTTVQDWTTEAFRWTTATGMVGLGADSSAGAVSADGSVVAGRSPDTSAAIWTEASGWTPLTTPPNFSYPTAISADGRVVGGEQDNPGFSSAGAFIWTEADGYTLLGNLGQASIPVTVPADISGDGSIWVGTEFDFLPSETRLGPQAIIWDQTNGMRALRDVLTAEGIDLTEWVTLRANGVSANGSMIAGWGTRTDGTQEAWIADLSVAPPATTPVDLSGTIKTPDGTDICAMVLASGQFMFSCNPVGVFSLEDLPRESNGTVKRQIYADGFFPKIDILTGSSVDAVVMTRSGTCPSYNTPYDPAFVPDSAGKRINIVGQVLLQNSQTPICAIVLANGQYMFSCDGTGSYALNIPLDTNGQFKLQVYADGFAPTIQTFDEFQAINDVRMVRAVECQ